MKILDRLGQLPFVVAIDRAYWRSGIAMNVPALTYFLMISLAPFILGATALTALALGNEKTAYEVGTSLAQFMPKEIRSDVAQLVVTTNKRSTHLLLLAVVTMAWTTSGAIGVLERVGCGITASRTQIPLVGKLRNLLLGALLAALVSSGIIIASTVQLVPQLLGWNIPAFGVGSRLLSLLAVCLMASLMLRLLLSDKMLWRACLAGGLFAGAAIQAVPMLIGLYLANRPGLDAVGIFVTLAVVVVGCYLLAHCLLIAVGLAAAVHNKIVSVPTKTTMNFMIPDGPQGDVLLISTSQTTWVVQKLPTGQLKLVPADLSLQPPPKSKQ